MTVTQLRAFRLIFLLAVSACLGDPTGPGGIRVALDAASPDTVLGAPGESVQPHVRLHVTNAVGVPVWGASVAWVAVGQGAKVIGATETDRQGETEASWMLGTNAAEAQQLNVTVRQSGQQAQFVVNARAVPHVVSQLRVVLDTPAVLRLGDTLPLQVNALDPYGNAFPAPDLTTSLADSGVGAVAGSSVIGGRRGHTIVHVASHGATAAFPLQVTQYVAGIVPASDTLWFSSIGADLPIAYTVRDDRGRIVADTTATISITDTTKARVTGSQVQSLAPGATDLHLAIGPTTATIAVGVQQRIASLALLRDTVQFDALLDTARLRSVARDSLNAVVVRPALNYVVSNPSVATLVSGRTLTAVAPGTTTVTVRDSVTGISATANVVVQQRVATIELPQAQIQFTAVGDTISVGAATARDRLGSVVVGAPLAYSVSDSTVVALQPDGRVRSVGAGQASLTVQDPESGVTGQVVVVVNQVAATLRIAVDSAKPIVVLPGGAAVPLACQALDKNGFAMLQKPTLQRSAKGTVSGATCADVRVQHSGYDTLFFALGSALARVPVVISTGDSVGVVGTAQPLTVPGGQLALSPQLSMPSGVVAVSQPVTVVERDTYVGEDLANPLVLALRPLVSDILAAYGNPTSNLDRARALRDWLARTAIHPAQELHPAGSTSNLSVLPPGKTWADANAAGMGKLDQDRNYWGRVGMDGYAMLDRLLGTLDRSTGRRADDGMMVQVEGARYRIRDVDAYIYAQCSYQDIMLNALLAAAGLQGMLISTVGHDPAAVFIPELARWVYEDPTFNEEYLLDGTGEPLSPTDLLSFSSAGEAGRLYPTKRLGPNFDPEPYIATSSYINAANPDGVVIMGSELNNRVVGIGGWPTRLVQIDVPRLAEEPPFNDPVAFPRVTAAVAFPTLGVVVQELDAQDSVYVVRLSSTLPNYQRFERRLSGGAWESAADVDVLPVGQCRVEYRSVDAVGNISASAALDVWAPRAAGFIESAAPGGVRARARYCM